jgi:hypothetical protein
MPKISSEGRDNRIQLTAYGHKRTDTNVSENGMLTDYLHLSERKEHEKGQVARTGGPSLSFLTPIIRGDQSRDDVTAEHITCMRGNEICAQV